jgi:hypothetical protein
MLQSGGDRDLAEDRSGPGAPPSWAGKSLRVIGRSCRRWCAAVAMPSRPSSRSSRKRAARSGATFKGVSRIRA